MERNGTKGLMVTAIVMLALVFVLALILTIVLLDKDGQDKAEAGDWGERLDKLEQEADVPAQDDDDGDYDDEADHEEDYDEDNDAADDKDANQGNNGGNNQGQQATNNDQQVVEALGYNYASNERPDLNWKITDSSVNGDNASVTVTANFAQGMETRTYNFKKQNGQWVFNGGGAGSAQAPPSP